MENLLRILRYLGRYKWSLIAAHIALGFALLAQLSIPKLVQYVIDHGISANDNSVIVYGSLLIVAAAAVQGVFTYGRTYLFQSMAERVSTDIRAELYEHMMQLSFGYFDTSQSGQLMSRATEDVNAIRRFLMFSMRLAIFSIAMFVIVTVLLVREDAVLAVMSLAIMPVLALSAVHFGRNVRPMFSRVQQQFGEMSSMMQENLAGNRVVRVFAREEAETQKFDRSIRLLMARQMEAIRYWSFYMPFMGLLSSISLILVLWYGGRQVLNGTMSVGTLVAFNLYLALLAGPVRNLGWIVNSVARAAASGERIFEVIDTRPTIRDRVDARVPEVITGDVRFECVSFRYPTADDHALQDISLHARPGEIIALFGPTGSGKSTIVSLIPRFYDVTSGRVVVDGLDVRDWRLAALRGSIGIVMQESFLFSTTIRENIAFGAPNATMEQIEAAARMARAHDFIVAMPDGYDSVLGERGVSLSGGQRQRVAIARALCSDPRILILDDATSSVDMETEFEIQQALKAAMVGRTTFVIAQRLSTLKHANTILVLDEGRVVERGDHLSLLARQGFYARMYDLQLRDQEQFVGAAD
ncbi:MAG: ABC transporter ATP-binding protein [Chloroflexi bacterium]|nr:MAG: ABC transporter ATP-binding protein [Chloroflexota bacterium]